MKSPQKKFFNFLKKNKKIFSALVSNKVNINIYNHINKKLYSVLDKF